MESLERVASVWNVVDLPSRAPGKLRAENNDCVLFLFSRFTHKPLKGSLAKQRPSPGDISGTGKLPEFYPSRVGLKVTWKMPQISKYPLCHGSGSWELLSDLLDISTWTCFCSGFSPFSNSWAGGWRNGAPASLASLGSPCEAGLEPSKSVDS